MSGAGDATARPFGRTPGFKFFMIMVLAVLMYVPLFMISLAVAERQGRANEAAANIEASWGRAQSVGGMYLIVPYELSDPAGLGTIRRRTAVLLPTRAEYSAMVGTEARS